MGGFIGAGLAFTLGTVDTPLPARSRFCAADAVGAAATVAGTMTFTE